MDKQIFISLATRLRNAALKAAVGILDNQEAEDVAQEVMLKMWERVEKLRNHEGELIALSYKMARNIALDRTKQKKRHPLIRQLVLRHDDSKDESAMHEPMAQSTPHSCLQERENDRLYQKALENLPYTWRRVMELRGEQEMEFEEIALILGFSESSVRSTLSKARARLIQNLKQYIK